MDDASLIVRIDELLRRSPPPPPHVLEKCVRVLRKARGGGAPATDSMMSSASSVSPTDAMMAAIGPPAAASTAVVPSAAASANESDMLSLGNMGVPDPRWERFKARHESRVELTRPVDVRERKIGQYQALLEGGGGKYVHADYVANGATQIAGAQSFTPSLTAAGGPKQMALVGGAMAAGKQPYCGDNKFNFRP